MIPMMGTYSFFLSCFSFFQKKAIALIKQQGQIEKEDPNEVPGKSKKRKSERVERSRKEHG